MADEEVGGRMREVAGLGSSAGSGGQQMDGGPWVAAGSVMRVGSQAGAAATSASCGVASTKARNVPGTWVVQASQVRSWMFERLHSYRWKTVCSSLTKGVIRHEQRNPSHTQTSGSRV